MRLPRKALNALFFSNSAHGWCCGRAPPAPFALETFLARSLRLRWKFAVARRTNYRSLNFYRGVTGDLRYRLSGNTKGSEAALFTAAKLAALVYYW